MTGDGTSLTKPGAAGDPSPGRRPRHRMGAAVGVFLLAVGLRAALMIAQQSYLIDDRRDHWLMGWETGRIASHLAAGRGFALEIDQLAPHPPTPTAWLAPVYPVIFAAVFRVFGTYTTASVVVILIVQILLSGWTAVLLLALGRALVSQSVGLLAALVFCVWPPAVAFPVNIIWGTTLFTALVLWLMLLLVRQAGGAGSANAALIGVVIAVLLLTEPAVALFFPAAAAWVLVRTGRRGLVPVLIMAAISAVLVAPWICRNYTVLGRLVFIKSNLGHELFIGNNPKASGYYRRTRIIARQVFDQTTYDRLAAAGEADLPRLLGDYALDYIREHPRRFAALTAKRIWGFWRLKFDARWDHLFEHRRVWERFTWFDDIIHDLLLILAYLGAVIGLKRRAGVGLPLLFLLTYPLPYYITHMDIPRYRFPFVPLVILLAAYTLVEVWHILRRRHPGSA